MNVTKTYHVITATIELVEIESYFDDIKQLQVKLANAEGALKQEKAREEGESITYQSLKEH